MSARLRPSTRAKLYRKSLILCNRGLRISFPQVESPATEQAYLAKSSALGRRQRDTLWHALDQVRIERGELLPYVGEPNSGGRGAVALLPAPQ